jgi:micrococcal nuclease
MPQRPNRVRKRRPSRLERLNQIRHRSSVAVALIGIIGVMLFAGSLVSFIVILSMVARNAAAPFAAEPTVVEVIDGDTIDVRIGYERHRVRLLGIDTPETKDPRKPVECFGPEASRYTHGLLPKGTVVRLEFDLEQRDAFNRLLAYVWRASDEAFINLELVAQGYADILTIAPNTAHADELRRAMLDAKQAPRGRWAKCAEAAKSAS